MSDTWWEEKSACLLLLHDITEHRRLERELREEKGVAEEASRVKGEFLAKMSHELRTPLNAIIGFSEGLLDRADQHPLNEHQKDRITKTLESGRRLLSLIDDVLDIVEIETGKIELRITTFDVPPLVEEISDLTATLIGEEADVTFSLNVQETLPLLSSDREKVKTILFNLLSNAVKFTEQGKIALGIRCDDGRFTMSVEDTGIGIPVDQVGKVFEKFGQAHTATRPAVGGAGLGLSIAKSLAELLGGKLTVESKEGRGSTFSLILPVAWVPGGNRT